MILEVISTNLFVVEKTKLSPKEGMWFCFALDPSHREQNQTSSQVGWIMLLPQEKGGPESWLSLWGE